MHKRARQNPYNGWAQKWAHTVVTQIDYMGLKKHEENTWSLKGTVVGVKKEWRKNKGGLNKTYYLHPWILSSFKMQTYSSVHSVGFLLGSYRCQWQFSGVLWYALPLGIMGIVLEMTQKHHLTRGQLLFKIIGLIFKWKKKHFQLKMLSNSLQENRKNELIFPYFIFISWEHS